MKIRNVYACIFAWLFVVGLSTQALSQTVTTSSVSPTSVCPGGAIIVTFTTTGSFSATNQFTAQLSNAAGIFPATPTVIGSSATPSIISAIIPATTPVGTGYRVRVVSSAPAALTASSGVGLVVAVAPNPGVAVPPVYCQGDTPTPLMATPSAGGTLNWYGTNPTGGTASPTATQPGTSATGNTTYYVTQTVNGCESNPRTPIVVSVKAKPAAPGTSPVSYCAGQTAVPLVATPAAGGTLNWYGTNATGGTASPTAPTPNGSATYYVSQTINGCESARSALVVTTNPVPPAPATTPPAPYCEGAPANPLSAAGQNLRWYGTSATGGTGSGVATTPNTSVVGPTNYYVTQTVNGCESNPRIPIAVQVNARPGAPTTPPVPAYCQNQAATPLVATPATGGTLNWYGTNSGSGTSSGIPTTPATTQSGTTTYYVSQSVNGCESPRINISVTVKALPAAPGTKPVVYCADKTPVPLVATPSAGGTLNWYGTNATGGTASPTAPTSGSSATYYISQTVNGCEGPRASLAVTVNPIPPAPTTTLPNPVVYCQGASAQALQAAGQSLRWYGTSSAGGTGSGSASVPGTTNVGTTTYYVTQNVGTCESGRAAIPVLVKATPDRPATTSVEFCQGTQPPTLTAGVVANATPNWYGQNASGGTKENTAPVLNNANVGTTTYYVSQTLDGCEGPRASVNARVKATPGAPGVNRISFCNNGPTQQLSATGLNLKWFDGAGNSLSGAPTPPTNNVGEQVYRVSQTSNENCESARADLSVTIKPLPGRPSVASLGYCQRQNDQPDQPVPALTAGGQNLRWYNPDGNAFPGAPTPSLDQAGVQTYQVSQTVDNCEGAKSTLQVTVNTTAAPVVPKPLVAYCINAKATPLEARIEPGASARWVDPYDRFSNDAPTPSTLNTNIDPAGDRFFVFQIGQNGCYSPRSVIRVVVNTTPTLSLVAPTTNVNIGLTVPLKLIFTGSAPYSYTLAGGYSGISYRNDTTITVLPRGNTTYQVTAVTNGCGVGLPGNPATAVVTVRVPTIVTGALPTSTLCSGTSLAVPFETTGQFNPGNTFRFELISLADTTQKYDVPATASGSPVTAPLPITIPGGRYAVRIRALNPEVGIVGTNSPTLLTLRSLPAATLTGTQTINEGTPANLTIAFGGDGPWDLTYADSLRSYSITTAVSPFVTEVRPARSTTYRITTVTNSCGSGQTSGTARVSVSALLGVEDDPLDPLVRAFPVPTERVLTVELNVPLTRNSARLSLINSQGQAIWQHTTRNRITELDLSAQPAGLYILRIQVGDRYTTRKILKQ